MSELKVDIDGINNKVIPPLNKAITKLESAADSLKYISYSPDYYKFNNRSRVQNILPQNIRSIKVNVNDVKKWLADTSSRFKQAEKNSAKVVDSLQLPTGNIGSLGQVSNKTSNKAKNVSQKTNKNVDDVSIFKETPIGLFGDLFNGNTESIYKSKYEGDLKLTQTEIIGENKKGTKLKDDPEIQQGLEQLNNLLNMQNENLKDDAEEMKSKLLNGKINPHIRGFLEDSELYSFEDPSDVNELILAFQKAKEHLEKLDYNEVKDADYYSCINGTIGLEYTKEDWDLVKKYIEDNNLSWKDFLSEYDETISSLETYRDELLDKKNQIYQLERYIDLYPYTKITQNADFKEYLERDYSNVDVESGWSKIASFFTFGFVKAEVGENFNEFTQEEKAIYFYLKEQYSEDEANEYYTSLEDMVNQRKGMKDALEYVKSLDGEDWIDFVKTADFAKTVGMGFSDGVWSFGEGLANLFPGNGEIMSELQYKQLFLQTMLTQEINLDEIEKNYGKDSEEYKLYEKLYEMQKGYRAALGTTYNVASTIGNEAIPMALSCIPEVGQTLGIALASLSDAGNAKATAYQNGITGWNAYLYAGIKGFTSAYITKKFAAIPGLSDNSSTKLVKMLKNSFNFSDNNLYKIKAILTFLQGPAQARTFCCCSTKNRSIYT